MSVFDPLWVGAGLVDDGVMADVSSYSHEIVANGGYWKANFTLTGDYLDAEDWFLGIGRHIEVYDESLTKIWEGFVNQIDVSLGTFSVSRGPLVDVANRVSVVYQTPYYNTNPPIGGERAETTVANNTDSQALYGVLEEVVSGGTGASSEEDQLRDTYLAEMANPQTGQQISIGGGEGDIRVAVECLGYVHWLDQYSYSQVAASGTISIDTKIEAILAADPNSIFSTNYNSITDNATTVSQYEDEATMALSLIRGLVSLGDASFNRYIFGVYNDRIFEYGQIPSDYEYIHLISDSGQKIVDTANNRVFPWDVRPGRWAFVSDFLIGHIVTGGLREDPRMIFIENVKYTAPWSVQLSGGKSDRYSQQLARLNMLGTLGY
jgi:hypothetical protein